MILLAIPLILVVTFKGTPAMQAASSNNDAAATYKAKCAACHSPTASKFYNPAKSDDSHVDVILKGKKGEKPPNMPGFGEKGMTVDEAKALAAHMRALKPAS